MASRTPFIPVIDLSNPDEGQLAKELVDAFRTIGFATLVHHSVPEAVLRSAFDSSASFFQLTSQVKCKYKYQGHKSNRGYIPMGSEKYESSNSAEWKETFDIGKEGESGVETPWPTELDNFKHPMTHYFSEMNGVYLRLLRLVAIGLELPDENFLVDRCSEQHCNLRLLHYPSMNIPDCQHKVVIRGARHTDFGTLTLLVQDQVGGLRAQHKDGHWIDVPPTPNSIVVNVGDMLQIWTNNHLVATPHQVVNNGVVSNETDTQVPERYSIAFFCNANKDVTLNPLDLLPNESPLHEPINSHDYITKRLAATINSK